MLKRIWTRIKKWVYGILVALGIVTVASYAEVVNFNYTPATFYEDGTPLPIEEIAETRLYCNGQLTVSEAGADSNFDPELSPGTYTCYATHVSIDGQESAPSNEVTKIVEFPIPRPPQNLTVD